MAGQNITRRQALRSLAATGAASLLLSLRDSASVAIAQAGRAIDQDEWTSVRDQYLLDPDINYLNNASIGTIPKVVFEAREKLLRLCETNPWYYMWGPGVWDAQLEETRQAVAAYVGCNPGELAITHNTTEGFNTLAQGLPLGPGDEVLFSSINHAGASICWRHMAEARGFSVRQFEFDLTSVPELTAEEFIARHIEQIREETRVLVLPHVDNIVGIRAPLAELNAAAKARGVEFVAVDGAQVIGMLPVNLNDTGVDFYCTSAHKWLQTPKGLGLMYVSQAAQQHLRPMWVTWGNARWRSSAKQFEDYGTRNLAESITLADAVAWQTQLDRNGKHARLEHLWNYARERAAANGKFTWRSPKDWKLASAVMGIGVPRGPAPRVSNPLFQRYKIVIRPFDLPVGLIARVSPHVYTSEADLDRFFTAVEELTG